MLNEKHISGKTGEYIAESWYKFRGYKIRETNYRGRSFEVDIIAENSKYLCFVEVKTRKSLDFGMPSEAVDYRKKQKIITGAKYYLMKHPSDKDIRFDVAEVVGEVINGKFKKKSINIIKNAFDNSL